jgi:HSP20 family protein
MAEKQSQPAAQRPAQQGMEGQVPVQQSTSPQGTSPQGTSPQGTASQGTAQQGSRTQESGLSRTSGTPSRDLSRQPYGGGYGSPFSFMRRFMEDMDHLFGDFGLGTGLTSTARPSRLGSLSTRAWAPQLEVFERQGQLVVRADLPGMKKDDVRVQIDNDVLTIEGERRYEHEETRAGVFHSERSYGSFQRAVQLPQGVSPESVTASFENGVLEITMPQPQARPSARNIEVTAGGGAAGTGAGAQSTTPGQQPKISH